MTYDYGYVAPILDPAVQQELLEQPADIEINGESAAEFVTVELNPTVDPGVTKAWGPDDVLIAQVRSDSDTRPLPFRDPVEQQISGVS